MNPKQTLTPAGYAALMLTLALLTVASPRGRAADDCVGKPYGTAGCPTFQSSSASSASSSVPPHCGDDTVQADEGEQCDEGRLNGTGACTSDCRLLTCGDGIVSRQNGEECEPQVEVVYATDPQTGQLTTERRYVSNACGITCTPPTFDAQGTLIGGCRIKFQPACLASSAQSAVPASSEQSVGGIPSSRVSSSDDSSPSSGASSVPLPSSESSAGASSEERANPPLASTVTQSSAPAAACGNGVVEGGEQCDEGAANGKGTCSALCTVQAPTPVCGNGVREPGEECDLGSLNGKGACTAACKVPACGNGIREGDETCDDGTANSNVIPNSCRTNCRLPRCGDGVVDANEQCDGGAQCTQQCRFIAAAASAASVAATPTKPALPDNTAIILKAIGVTLLLITAILTYLLWNNILRLLGLRKSKNIERNIDDVPLDQIEQPWQKW